MSTECLQAHNVDTIDLHCSAAVVSQWGLFVVSNGEFNDLMECNGLQC